MAEKADKGPAPPLDEPPWAYPPDRPRFSEHGLEWHDIALIQDALRLSPAERIHRASAFLRSVEKLRRAARG